MSCCRRLTLPQSSLSHPTALAHISLRGHEVRWERSSISLAHYIDGQVTTTSVECTFVKTC